MSKRQAETVARIIRGLRSEPSALDLARALNEAYSEGIIEANMITVEIEELPDVDLCKLLGGDTR